MIVDKIHPKDFYTSGATIESVEQSIEKLKVKLKTKGKQVRDITVCASAVFILSTYKIVLY